MDLRFWIPDLRLAGEPLLIFDFGFPIGFVAMQSFMLIGKTGAWQPIENPKSSIVNQLGGQNDQR